MFVRMYILTTEYVYYRVRSEYTECVPSIQCTYKLYSEYYKYKMYKTHYIDYKDVLRIKQLFLHYIVYSYLTLS